MSLISGKKFVHEFHGEDKLFFPNLYKLQNLYILMDFYLVISKQVCQRSSRPMAMARSAPNN
jgi:hypothetical protein